MLAAAFTRIQAMSPAYSEISGSPPLPVAVTAPMAPPLQPRRRTHSQGLEVWLHSLPHSPVHCRRKHRESGVGKVDPVTLAVTCPGAVTWALDSEAWVFPNGQVVPVEQ